jgi:fumarate hydratase class I
MIESQASSAARKRSPLASFMFASRWLQLPLYLGLILAQCVYVFHFWVELKDLVLAAMGNADALQHIFQAVAVPGAPLPTKLNETTIMLVVLGPDRRRHDLEPADHGDRRRLRNLRVAHVPGDHPDQPEWLSHVNASVLKTKLAMAIIGISSIHLLKTFINAQRMTSQGPDRPNRHPYRVPAVGHGHRLHRPHHDPTPQAAPNTKPERERILMTVIKQDDLIESVAAALQYISYYHPADYIQHLARAYEAEQSPAAKDAIAQILTNSKMCAEGKRPICQDTGIVNVFLKVGMNVRFEGFGSGSITDAVNEGVRRAYNFADNKLRASIVADPHFERKNTKDNTPAVVHMELVPGDTVDVMVAAKGGGSENKTKFVMLNPSDSLVDWVLKTVPLMGAGWCPPGMLGIGIGGSAEKAMLMAKESLMEDIDMYELKQRGPQNKLEELRIELCDKINALGIGAQGLGGLTTVLDVKINMYPTHAASKPVAMIPNCAATRHAHFVLDGSGPSYIEPPALSTWPDVQWTPDTQKSKSVNLDTLTKEEVASWQPGQTLLLNGKMLTGRDAAHKRIQDMLARGEKLPVDFTNRVIYYVGPVDPVGDEVVGPAGPTTATRMDKFTDMMLEQTGLIAMIGKAERGPAAIESIKNHKSAYLMAVGGSAYLVSKAIKSAKVLGFEDLGMEAIYEFEVKDMPVTVAVDSTGTSVHTTGPKEWAAKIESLKGIPVNVA